MTTLLPGIFILRMIFNLEETKLKIPYLYPLQFIYSLILKYLNVSPDFSVPIKIYRFPVKLHYYSRYKNNTYVLDIYIGANS